MVRIKVKQIGKLNLRDVVQNWEEKNMEGGAG
jgi:hypothetical protein